MKEEPPPLVLVGAGGHAKAVIEVVRAEGRFEKLRETITERDVSWTGSSNPMLTTHGERSEASQYSGRAVPVEWNCPLRRSEIVLPADSDETSADKIAADLRGGAFLAPPPGAAEQAPK